MLALAVIFLCLAGMVAGSAGMMVLFIPPEEALEVRAGVTITLIVVTLIFWAIGSACLRFRRAAAHMGWVMLGGGGMSAMTIASIYAGLGDPNARKAYGPDALAILDRSDPTTPITAVAGMIALGGALLWLQARADARRAAEEQGSVEKVFR